MFRNRYDTDAMTWSPAGRLLQVEYAMAAVNQGYAAVGLRSSTHVVLAAVNKAPSDLSSHKHKIFKVDDHVGIATAGLAADSRMLSQYLRDECINHAFVYDAPMPVGRLVVRLADKAQARTQRSRRPYGVGVLVAGSDESGVHLYHNCPSGNYSEYQAFAIGSRSAAAISFLERRFTWFNWYSSEDFLIDVAILAVKEALPGKRLTGSVCTVAVVGVGEPFRVVDPGAVQETIQDLEKYGEIVYRPSGARAVIAGRGWGSRDA